MSITVVIHCKNNENSVIKHFVRVFCVRNICDCHKLSELRYKFVCSQFVAYVLEECGVRLDKAPCLYSPDDLRYLPDAKLIYRGELNRYYHEQNQMLSYMPMVSAV